MHEPKSDPSHFQLGYEPDERDTDQREHNLLDSSALDARVDEVFKDATTVEQFKVDIEFLAAEADARGET